MRRRRDGQAIVEFALVLPVALLLLCAVTDFGRYVVSHSECVALCHDAARFASQVHPETGEFRTVDSIIERARSSPPSGVASQDLDVVVETGVNVSGHQAVRVTISYSLPVLTAVAETFFPGGQMPVSASAIFVYQ